MLEQRRHLIASMTASVPSRKRTEHTMGKRRRAREFALQVLYQLDIRKERAEEVLHQFWKENDVEKEVQNFTNILVKGVEEKRSEIDKLLSEYALNWDLSRMSVVDRNILRLGSLEILFLKEIPFAVSINEAIELAKSFGTDDSFKFINGILNRVKDVSPPP